MGRIDPADCRPLTCLECGETVFPGPRDRGMRRDVKYLVAYDVCLPRRLRRVAKVCEDYGIRIQKSVFECDLEPNIFNAMWTRLCAEIEENEDFLVAYAICRSCSTLVVSAGIMVRPEKVLAYVC
jgi:CRISPR-associated protein Cas2